VNNVVPLLQALQQPMHRAGRQPGRLPQLAEPKAGFSRRDAFQQIERATQRLDGIDPLSIGTLYCPLRSHPL
jgi:hypothetical protein